MRFHVVVAAGAVATALALPAVPATPALALAPAAGVTPAVGVITTVAGGLGRGPATTVNQSPVALARAGRYVYVTDSTWRVIRVVDTVTGEEEVLAGTGDEGATGDGGPAVAATVGAAVELAVSPAGELYIAEGANSHKVRKIDASGRITAVVGTGATGAPLGDGGPASAAHLVGPGGITFDARGQLFVAETGGQRIRKVDTSGIISTIAGTGVRGYSGDGGSALHAGFDVPHTVAVDSRGRLYVADSTARVRMVDTDGTITTVVGNGIVGTSGDGGPATAATIGSPTALGLRFGRQPLHRRLGPGAQGHAVGDHHDRGRRIAVR